MIDDALKKALEALIKDVETKDIQEAVNNCKTNFNSDIRKKINDSLKNKTRKIVI